MLCSFVVCCAQEVRVEKEGIERRIDELAQDAAGLAPLQPGGGGEGGFVVTQMPVWGGDSPCLPPTASAQTHLHKHRLNTKTCSPHKQHGFQLLHCSLIEACLLSCTACEFMACQRNMFVADSWCCSRIVFINVEMCMKRILVLQATWA